MKRAELVRHLTSQGCELFREGGRHSVYWNPSNRKTTAVPRHTEILTPVVNRTYRDLGVPRPSG
jgi:predicted RNA binding protein YcfA (HicA-like mRNA interferase family)